jgi:hypothetical protein
MRAPRYTLHLLLRYRRIGEAGWHHGQTQNISRSGVFFRTDDPIEVNAPVELSVVLATSPVAREAAEVHCRGRVVRTVAPWENDGVPGSAVVIEDYAFLPPPVSSVSVEV